MRKFLLGLVIILGTGLFSSVFAAVSAPSNLNVNWQGFTGGQFIADLGWIDNSNNEAGFELYRSFNTGSVGTKILTLPPNTNSTLVYSGGYNCFLTTYSVRAYTKNIWKSRLWLVSTIIEYSPFSNPAIVLNYTGSVCY